MVRRVIVDDFCMSVNEVSIKRFDECVADGACQQIELGETPRDLPMHSVKYSDIMDFVSWFREKTALPYDLPSEAQWQQAALGGLEERFPWRIVGRLPDLNIFSDGLRPVDRKSVV